MSEIMKRIGSISPAKRDLLLQMLERKKGKTSTSPLVPRKVKSPTPLSFAQQRLWFLDQWEPGSTSYNIFNAVIIHGPLRREVFAEALNEVVRRHEALRTTFDPGDGKALALIAPSLHVPLPVEDLRSLEKPAQDEHLSKRIVEESQNPFDLSVGPLVRANLLQLAEKEHVLLLTMHHIVSDAWSFSVLIKEMTALYRAFLEGKPSPLPDLPIQYADFALWQRQWLDGSVREAQLAYWKQQLVGAPPLELPTDKPRPPVQRFQGASLHVPLPKATMAALHTLSQRTEATLFMTLLAAFDVLLARISGSEDVCVGTPVAGRNRADVEGLIGFFVNTLVLRTHLEDDPSFLELLRRVRETTLSAYDHQDVPFDQVVDAIQPPRDLSRTPLFQVLFVLQNAPLPRMRLDELEFSPLPVETATAKFDLTLTIEGAGDDMQATIEYNTDLFEASTIARFFQHYQVLLESVVERPDRRISELPILTGPEARELIFAFNDTRVDLAPARTVLDLFYESAARSPEKAAIAFEGESMSYRVLGERVNQLARELAAHGVGPGVRVGVALERSLDMVVALLGVLAAGGAYVPLDPSYPRERLGFMMEDANPRVLLTDERNKDLIPCALAEVICIDTDWAKIARHSKERLSTAIFSESLAYVIYTSGSTGIPKGVQIPHRALVNFLCTMAKEPGIHAEDKLLAVTSLSFDIAGLEIYLPLSFGASVEIASRAMVTDGAALAARLDRGDITLMQATPSTYRLLSELDWKGQDELTLLVGGEALPPDLAKTLLTLGARVFNMYGPTETTIWSSVARLLPDDKLTIGQAIANTEIHVLDGHMNLQPIGVPGELYIGGDGLAHGYLRRPGLSAERFVPNPFGKAGSRLYRTGDLCRRLPDGRIEFFGRLDHQVKIRGFRIELGEIESVISQHQAIGEVVVIVREDTPGNKRLVAYVVAREGHSPSNSELRALLKERLPDYMVPALFVTLDKLPLTANGKIDRRALPAPDLSRPELERSFVAPRTLAEKTLADVWSHVLGAARVGVEDNFFELGGDSILSIQVIIRARQAGFVLTPKQLFEHPTVAELAQVAKQGETVAAEQGLVAGPVPLTPIQHWLFDHPRQTPQLFNQATLVELRKPIDPALLEQAFHQLLLHHDALRLRFQRTEEGWRQRLAGPEAAAIALLRQDLSALPEEEIRSAIQTTAARLQVSLDLENGPLVRAALFELGQERPSRLLIVIHHLAVDGVSWRILFEDLELACEQLCRGETLRLPPKTTSFKRWADRLVDHARSSTVEAELPHWLSLGQVQVGRLPVDFPGGSNTVASARSVSLSLSAEETRVLLHDVPEVYRTQINDVLLTAWTLAISRWTREPAAFFDLEGHGREDIGANIDVSRTMGWFTTIFPVYLSLHANASLGEALKSIKEQLRRIPHRGIGYGLLRYLSSSQEITDACRALPTAEVSFNYLGQTDAMESASCWFSTLRESIGPDHAPGDTRRHLLDVLGIVARGQLQLELIYSENLHRKDTIDALVREFVSALRLLIAHCSSSEAGGYTPSDFPLAKLDQAMLDRLFGADRQIEDVYPLTAMQQGMLYHTLYAPESGVYFEQTLCTLEGTFDQALFQDAWKRVLDRHPVLRTSFCWEGLDEPVQIVHRHAAVPWEIEDWRQLSATEQKERLDRFFQNNRERGFQLAEAPLMRIALLRRAENTYCFLVSYHHILLDGWCSTVLLKEAFTFYNALQSGTEVKLEQTRPYRDYLDWLSRQSLSDAEAFWRKRLEGFTTPTPLSVGRPVAGRPDGSAQYVELWSELSEAASEAIVTYARQHRLTLNTLVQGAWALLLSRYSGEEDVLFGTIVSGRPAEIDGIESMIGLFINAVPVRVCVSPEQSVLSFLQKIQEQQTAARQYEHTPLAQIQRWSDVRRGQHLFDSLFVFENYPVDAAMRIPAQGLEIRDAQTVERTYYPLTVTVGPGTRIAARLSYWDNQFDADVVTRMMGHFKMLLEGLATDPERTVSTLPLLTEAERHQLLIAWNDTRADYPAESCIHQLFEAQVERTPHAVAVICGDETLTYRELNERANQLAHHIQSMGVGPETLVGLCVERSLQMAIGLLGILKAGGAYVPLDPSYPFERLAFMLEDAGVPVLLTQDRLIDLLPTTQAILMCLDTEWQSVAGQSTENPTSEVTPESLAYVIYTSGSTGKPKGTLIVHRGVVNYLSWAARTYPAAQGAPVHSSLAFDLTVTSLITPLIAGGRVVLLPEEKGIDALASTLTGEEEFGLIKLTPLHLRLLNQHLSSRGAKGRARSLVIGGDQLTAEIIAPWRNESAETLLFNEYGPTETVVGSCIYPVPPGTDPRATLPIGRPIANTQIYVLDRHGQPLPIGVPGELHIAGEGVARGYLNRPELTAQKFISNPFADQPNARMYKTGDLARWLSDGNLEFLGRSDHQVKIRGFRIELGEIETVLAQQRSVEDAAVVVREDTPGDRRLVAYVVPSEGEAPSTSALRGYLKDRLPEYMIPALFVMLDALPMTSNGKVDRRALPAPDQESPDENRMLDVPRNPTEEALVSIWVQVLNVKRVGIRDDFFDLGGDSILAMQIVSKAQAAGIGLSVRQILEQPTIADLAALATTVTGSQAEQGLVIGPVPLTPIQRWFFERHLPNPHHFNQAIMLETPEQLDPLLLEEAIVHMLRHHDALRLCFMREEGEWRQFNAGPEGRPPITSVDLSAVPLEQQAGAIEAAAAEAQTSLHIDQGPLLRVVQMNLGSGRPARLLIVVHHLAVDGVSWRILLEDLQTAYKQLQEKQAVRLPLKTTSFRQWAERLSMHAQSDAVKNELSFWLASSRAPVSPLPIDMSKGANTVASAKTLEFSLNAEETQALLQRVTAAYHVQINDILLTALGQAFAPWLGARSLRIDLEGHGREEIAVDLDLSRTVGWFTTIFPVHLELPEAPTAQILSAVKEQIHSIPNRGFGYGLLRYLHDDPAIVEQLRALPRPEVSLNYLGRFDESLQPSSGFALARESIGLTINPRAHRTQLLEINGWVTGGELHLEWIYSESFHHRTTIEALAQRFMETLRALIAGCPEVVHHGDALPEGGLEFSTDNRKAARGQEGASAPRPWSPLVEIQPLGSGRPFFCVHAGGGTVMFYAELARQLGTERPFYGLQARGIDDEAQPNTNIEVMATQYVAALRTIQPEGPYLLGGYSFGGLVAFEIARQLSQQGHPIGLLAVMDMTAPHDLPNIYAGWDDAMYLTDIAHLQNIEVSVDELRRLGSEEQLSHVLYAAWKAKALPPGVGTQHLKQLLSVYKAHVEARQSYVAQRTSIPITLLRTNPSMPAPDGWPTGIRRDPLLGWGRFSVQPINVLEMPGSHETLLKEPHVRILAEQLKLRLHEAERPQIP